MTERPDVDVEELARDFSAEAALRALQALASLRHAYQQAYDFHIGDQRTYAEHLLGPAIEKLEQLALAEAPATCGTCASATDRIVELEHDLAVCMDVSETRRKGIDAAVRLHSEALDRIAALEADLAAARAAMYSGDEDGVTCACRWEAMPKGAGASGPQVRECAEHLSLREAKDAAEADLAAARQRAEEDAEQAGAVILNINAAKLQALAAKDAAEARAAALAGCSGGCACEIWTSRHEAAMALYGAKAQRDAAVAEVARLRAALHASRVNFREMAEDYPGSSFELWCHRAMAIIDAALKEQPC